jgi:hypothetical protein
MDALAGRPIKLELVSDGKLALKKMNIAPEQPSLLNRLSKQPATMNGAAAPAAPVQR